MAWLARTVSANGQEEELEIEAPSREEALQEAEADGRAVLELRRRWAGSNVRLSLLSLSGDIASLLEAGLPLAECLELLVEKEQRPLPKKLLQSLYSGLQQGLALSKSMERHPEAFSSLYRALVASGESGGNLPEVLRRYAEHERRIQLLRRKLISAALYPSFLLATGALVVVFLMLYVMPRFALVFESSANPSFFASLMLEWSKLLQQHGGSLSLAFFVGVCGAGWLLFRKETATILWGWLEKVPMAGGLMVSWQLSRLYRTLGMLLKGGMPLLSAMVQSRGVLPLGPRTRLLSAEDLVASGTPLSLAFSEQNLLSPVAARLIKVGESTGNLGEMLEKTANLHDEELDEDIERISRLVEPILMMVIGIVVGGIVVLMYSPIFELSGTIH